MGNSWFEFKQFTIHQDRTAMKVGTDGVLLGAWAVVGDARNILDIGTGTGLIALMLAQKSKADITAIEIDRDAALQARRNAKCSQWNGRIEVIHQSFQDFTAIPERKYDVIITNPPFFNLSLHAPDKQRTVARHDEKLKKVELLQGVKELLSEGGKFYIILPSGDEKAFVDSALIYRLFCVKKLYICPTIRKKPKRVLMLFSHHHWDCETSTIAVEKDARHEYTEEYKVLTKEYYLAF